MVYGPAVYGMESKVPCRNSSSARFNWAEPFALIPTRQKACVNLQRAAVSPIVDELLGYTKPTVWFQRYVSLSVQEVGRIDLLGRVRALGTGANENKNSGEIISPHEYLFEPSVEDVVRYLEAVMMEIALSQVILESRLAQYASRFTAMSAAKKRAKELQLSLVMAYNRAKRGEADDRIKEIVNAMNALSMS